MADRERLEEMLAASPNDEFLKYALAMTFVSEGNPDEALCHFAAMNETHPDYVGAWFQRAQLLAKQGEIDEARSVVESGIEAARRIGDAHNEAEMRGFLDLL